MVQPEGRSETERHLKLQKTLCSQMEPLHWLRGVGLKEGEGGEVGGSGAR